MNIDERLRDSDIEKIDHEFTTLLYQFQDNDTYNEVYFREVEAEASELLHSLFEKEDEIILFVNQELKLSKKYRPIVKKIIHDLKLARFSGHDYTYTRDSQSMRINQLIVKTKTDNINWSVLIREVIHEDFPDRRPRFPRSLAENYPDVYLYNPKTSILLHIYDDRGYELYIIEDQ